MHELQNVWHELMELTKLRRCLEEDHDTFSQLFAPLREDGARPLTYAQLDQAKDALEQKVPGFSVWYVNGRGYGLFPNTSYKPSTAQEPASEEQPINQQRRDFPIDEMSDQEVTHRYTREVLKLRTLNRFGRQSKRFLGYPNTLVMNLCKRELERRSLPLPRVGSLEEKPEA